MTDVHALPCLTCDHPIGDHDEHECWNYEESGKHCPCPWRRWKEDDDD